MNKTHRSLWNCALGAWVAVAEITRVRGKRSTGGDAQAGKPAVGAMGYWPPGSSHLGSILASLSVLGGSMLGLPAWAQKKDAAINHISEKVVLEPSHARHQWVLRNNLYIAPTRQGMLIVKEGSTVRNIKGVIGHAPAATGHVMVTDATSAWTNDRALVVGDFGEGTLTVSNGGSVRNTQGTIGDYRASSGKVTVTGAASSWSNSGDLTVGREGKGTLTVSERAKVSAKDGAGVLRVALNKGSTGAVNIGGARDSPAQPAGTLAVKKLRFGPGDGSLNFNHTNTDYVFGAEVVGFSLGLRKGIGLSNGSGRGAELGLGQPLSLSKVLSFSKALSLSQSQGQLNHRAGITTFTGNGNYKKTVVTGGTLIFAKGAKIENDQGIVDYGANSEGEVIVRGLGAVWNHDDSLIVGQLGTGLLRVDDGGTVHSKTGLVGDELGASGQVLVSGKGSTWTNYHLTVGGSGTGALLVSAGGRIENFRSTIGAGAAHTEISHVTVSGGGSAWTDRTMLIVGQGGHGALTVSDGAAVDNTEGIIGNKKGSTGKVTVSGEDSRWTSLEGLFVGDAGRGTLTVSDGGTVGSDEGIIGNEDDSSGDVTVTGAGSSWTNSGALLVGSYGNGTLKVNNGGKVGATKTIIGNESGSIGEVMITGSILTGKELFVGDGGNGILTLQNGGKVHSTEAGIGFQAGSTGMVTVTGQESAWINREKLIVGAAGLATLAVSQGGAVSNSQASIGLQADSRGAVIVTGITSTWTNNGDLYVGHSGNGTLTVKKGGVVKNLGRGHIGFEPDSTGSVTVSDAGSNWASQKELVVGRNGEGRLTVSDGAKVSVNNGRGALQVAVKKKSTGVVNIGGATGSPAQWAGSVEAQTLRFGGGAGSLNFNHLNNDYRFGAKVIGLGQLNHIEGTTILTGANAYTGATNVTRGTLQAGASKTFSAASAYNVAASASLNLAGFDQTLASLHNAGTVKLSAATLPGAGFTGTTLKITGPYVGEGGRLAMSAALGGDGSASDRLLFSGGAAVASGRTIVQITNVGGMGAPTTARGIEIIHTENGARLGAGTFTLDGGHVDAGAFEYRLMQTPLGASLHSSAAMPVDSARPSINSPAVSVPATMAAAAAPVSVPAATAMATALPVATLLTVTPTVAAPATTTAAATTSPAAVPVVVSPVAKTPVAEQAVAEAPHVTASPEETGPTAASADVAALLAPQPVAPAYRAEVPLLSALPAQLRQADMAMLGDLHKRLGDEIRDSGAGYGRRAWARVLRTDQSIRQQGTVSPQSSGHLSGFQAGLDLYADPGVNAGLYVGELNGNMAVNGFASGVEGKSVGHNQLQSRYLGVYGSWHDDAGLYADAVVQLADYRSNLHTDNSTARTEGSGWLASLELGRPIALNSQWQVEPQAQLVYRQISLDGSALSGANVQHSTPSDWTLRLGLRVKGSLSTAAGVLQPYGRINIYTTSSTTDVARFSTPAATTAIHAQGGSTSTELAAGATLQLSQRTNVYGELGQRWANAGDTRVKGRLQASLGVKVRW